MHTFDLPKGGEKHYQQQYADMYFLRLAQLKEAVKQRAEEAWGDFTVTTPTHSVYIILVGSCK